MSTTRHLPYGFQIRLNEKKHDECKSNPARGEVKENVEYIYYVNPPKIHALIFKGGGFRVFVYKKFIQIAKEYNALNFDALSSLLWVYLLSQKYKSHKQDQKA